MCGQTGHNIQPQTQWPPRVLGMDAWMTSQLNVALIRKLSGPLMCLDYFFDMSLSVFTTRYWQTFGQPVQELNGCTVPESGHPELPVRWSETLRRQRIPSSRSSEQCEAAMKSTVSKHEQNPAKEQKRVCV